MKLPSINLYWQIQDGGIQDGYSWSLEWLYLSYDLTQKGVI